MNELNIQANKISFHKKLLDIKHKHHLSDGYSYYGYNTINNIDHIYNLLNGDLSIIENSQNILDMGCGDGDISFFLESIYPSKKFYCLDFPATNWNNMQGIYTIKKALASDVEIIESNLDDHKTDIENHEYDMVLVLGLLYHLKHPLLLLEKIHQLKTKYLIMSTRIARFLPAHAFDISNYSVAYLAQSREINNDPTNWWIFTQKSLEVLFQRTGWNLVKFLTVGDNNHSTPIDNHHDQRYFALLKRN